MKHLLMVFILLGSGLLAAPALSDSPDSGFFVGGVGNVAYVMGTGTWNGIDFSMDQPMSDEEGSTVGFSWSENILIGVKPLMGYKFNRRFTLQAGYNFAIPKSSEQVYSETDLNNYYEQGLQVTWKQKNLEILAVYYPDPDQGFYLYAGWDRVSITTDITLYEGVEYEDYFGNIVYEGEQDIQSDDISANGVILGLGIDFPSESQSRVVFLSAQYSSAQTNDVFFGTPDFKVDVGGFSFMAGLKWFPGGGSDPSR